MLETYYVELAQVYQIRLHNGQTAYVYLLDEVMHMDKVGVISKNLAKKITMTSTEGMESGAEARGERISEEEAHDVKQMEAGQGKEQCSSFLRRWAVYGCPCRARGYKKMKKQEMKVFTMYEG